MSSIISIYVNKAKQAHYLHEHAGRDMLAAIEETVLTYGIRADCEPINIFLLMRARFYLASRIL